MSVVRKQIILKGILQGIGLRPTVYRLATKHGLSGWVINTTEAVRIEIEGARDNCDWFLSELPTAIPSPGRIEVIQTEDRSPLGETSFSIKRSIETQRDITPIPPDVAVCPECASELLDPKNRRHLFPFITCTLCGPRFTVVRAFPYDRERTSMADFVMCEDCKSEYLNPNDRRFHSQTNSCPKCGPQLSLLDNCGRQIEGDQIVESIRLLKQGKIIAVKGIGGFHLAVDALNENAVQRLRDLKGRAEKPFAVMTRDIEEARKYCVISSEEELTLKSAIAPIVLLRAYGEKLAPSIAPFVGTLGVMLPYSPIHHLLFKHPHFGIGDSLSTLVMTSGNRSEEPIAAENDEALERLSCIADAFLTHNRQIVLRADDSIVRVIRGQATVFRRSRGYVPMSFRIVNNPDTDLKTVGRSESADGSQHKPENSPTVLGVGADLKNAPAILDGQLLTPGPHVGDLESPEAQDYFARSINTLTEYLEVTPSLIAFDPHPGYFSSSLAQQYDKKLIPVYHHHAHAVSLLLEHAIDGPILFVVFDGTGYGDDGTIWGGEFLLADRIGFQRVARLRPFSLIGAEAAIREPIRIVANLIAISNGGTIPERMVPLFGAAASKTKLWLEAWKKDINSPLTSSAGRFFDAAAVLAGFTRHVTFEGQAAMWLESIADDFENKSYVLNFHNNNILEPDVASLLTAMAEDALNGTSPEKLAARFHNSIANLIVETVQKLSHCNPTGIVGLTGGCFQNKRLAEDTADKLEKAGYKVLCHQNIPVNDGGIAIGQAVAGKEIWLRGNRLYDDAVEN